MKARLENSSQIPRVDTLIKVAVALGMNINLIETDEEASAVNELTHVNRQTSYTGSP